MNIMILPRHSIFTFFSLIVLSISLYTILNGMESSGNTIRIKIDEETISKKSVRTSLVMIDENDAQIGAMEVSFSEKTKEGYIEKLEITPSHRNKGYGHQFLEYICTYLHTKWNCTRITLNAAPCKEEWEKKLIAFYRKAGFVLDEKEPHNFMYKTLFQQYGKKTQGFSP